MIFTMRSKNFSMSHALQVTLEPKLLKSSTNAAFENMMAAVKKMAGTDHLDLGSAARAIVNFDAGVAEAERLGISLTSIGPPP